MLIENLKFPEGPTFDHNGNLWCVEQNGSTLFKINLEDQSTERIHVGGRPNGMAISKNGVIWFCDSGQNAIRTYSTDSQTKDTIVNNIEDSPLNMPNDLAFDNFGNLIFSCPGATLEEKNGYICLWTNEGKLYKILEDLYYPNGVAFSHDYNFLFFADTGTKTIWKCSWNKENLVLGTATLFTETGGSIGPDGMTFDEDGILYVAIYGEGRIDAYNPNGTLHRQYSVEGKNPTNCAFDPSGKRGLAVTEAQKGNIEFIPILKKGIM